MNPSTPLGGSFKNFFSGLFGNKNQSAKPLQTTASVRRVTGVVDRVGVSDACEYYAGYVMLLEGWVRPFRFIAERPTHVLHTELGLVKPGDLVSFDLVDNRLTGSNFVNETLKARHSLLEGQ